MDKLMLMPALRIALIYLLLSVTWIALSDRMVAEMFTDPQTLTMAQNWKGWGFVSVTALLLGLLVHKEVTRYAKTHHDLDLARGAQIASEQRYHRMFAQSPLPAWVFDVNTQRILAVNDAAIRHYGYSRDEWLQLTLQDLRPSAQETTPEDTLQLLTKRINSGNIWRHARKDGTRMEMEIATHTLDFENHPACMVIAKDITEQRQAEERIYHLAYFDALTGLPNRALLMERLHLEVKTARQHRTILIFFDLDHFKDINDSLGHKAGDALLVEVANRLSHIMPQGGNRGPHERRSLCPAPLRQR